eukprot:480522-Hanusia_phi.AAC.4
MIAKGGEDWGTKNEGEEEEEGWGWVGARKRTTAEGLPGGGGGGGREEREDPLVEVQAGRVLEREAVAPLGLHQPVGP